MFRSIYLRKENSFPPKNGNKQTTPRPAEIITVADYAGYAALLANTPAQAKSLLNNLEQAARGIGLYVKLDKTEFMYLKQDGAIFS